MIMIPEARIVTCWSFIFSGIFTGGILKVRFGSLGRIGDARMTRTKARAAYLEK
jgi:hypothetical protein